MQRSMEGGMRDDVGAWGRKRPFRNDFFKVVCDIECSKNPFEEVMKLDEEEILSFSFYQLYSLSRYAKTDAERKEMFERLRKLWLSRNGDVSIRVRAAPETAAPVELENEEHADRVNTLFTVLAQHCACPLDSEGHISFASDFTREALVYKNEEPKTFEEFVVPEQRYRFIILDPFSWELFQLKARIVNRHLPYPPVGISVASRAASKSSEKDNGKGARRRITTYAGYCDIYSIATDPVSRAEAELQRRGDAIPRIVSSVKSLSEIVRTLQHTDTGKFAYSCPARVKFVLRERTGNSGQSRVLAFGTNVVATRAPNEERFLLQLAYYHTLEMQRYYAQSRFAPWADEDTKPQLAALISRGQHYRAQLIDLRLLPEDAPWIAPPAIEKIGSNSNVVRTVDHLRAARRDAQTSFALNPRYNGTVKVVINTYSDTSIDGAARHYINKEERAPELIMHDLFPKHYFRSTQNEDAPPDLQGVPPNSSLLPGDTNGSQFLPPLSSLPKHAADPKEMLARRSVGTNCDLLGSYVRPICQKLYKRSFLAPNLKNKHKSEIESSLLRMFERTLGELPGHLRVTIDGNVLDLECDDPAYIHYASLLSFTDYLLDDMESKPLPLHPLLLRLFAVRPRRRNFQNYGWEGPANGFFDLAHMYCFARVLAHWCNRIDPYMPPGVSPDRYLCKPADSAEHFNHYTNTHKYIALFAAGDGTPIMDAIRERGLLANIGRFLTFKAAAYIHRDAYSLMQQWVQNQIAYAANSEFMRHHNWILDHFSHPVGPLVCKENPMFIRLSDLCKEHNRTHKRRMKVTHALDGRGAISRTSEADFALRLYKAAIDMRFVHHKLAILLATSLANEPDPSSAPMVAIDLVVEPESCDHELLDWQQFRSTSWVRAFLAERAVADPKSGGFDRKVTREDIEEFYSALHNISPSDTSHPHAFSTCVHTQIDSDRAESTALQLLQSGGRTEDTLRASQDHEDVLRVQKEEHARTRVTDPYILCDEEYSDAYYRRLLFLAYRVRLDPDLAVCLPPAQRAAFRVGEPITTQAHPWDPDKRPFDLESLTYTAGQRPLDPAIPTGDPRVPLAQTRSERELPTEADLAGIEPHLAVPLPWVHTIAMQIGRLLAPDLHVRILSAAVASTMYPESRFSPSYSVTVEEEKQKDYLVRLDSCEMYMLYKAISHVLPEELTHDLGEDEAIVEQAGRFQQDRGERRTTLISQNSVACSSGSWVENLPLQNKDDPACVRSRHWRNKGRKIERAMQDAENGVKFVLHYDDDSKAGLNGEAAFVDADGRIKLYKKADRRGRKRRSDSMHDTLDERCRPVAPSIRKYAGRQYKAYYVHNGLGAPSRLRVAFFCHGAYALLIRACDRARFVETIRRNIPYDAQLDFGRLGYRILPVDRFREEWGLRRRVAYAPADEVLGPLWDENVTKRHTDLDVGVERAQGYGTSEKRSGRLRDISKRKKLVNIRMNVPARTFKFPRRNAHNTGQKAGYKCEGETSYYTNPSAYWGLVDWMSAGGSRERTGDFRMTSDSDTLNPLLTVLGYLDAATVNMPEKTRALCAPIDYLEYDYLSIAGPGLRDLPICVSPSGERPLTLASCLPLKI